MTPLKTLLPEYLRHLRSKGYAARTIEAARYELKAFLRFLETEQAGTQKALSLEALTLRELKEYQQELSFRLTPKGRPLSLRSQGQMLSVVKGFTRYLYEQEYLLHDPGRKLPLPKKPRQLPKVILNEAEMGRLICEPDRRTHRGFRNRLILEVLYDTAVRRSELSNLRIGDLDLKAGYVHIRSGKGNKDRVVPLSDRVAAMIEAYLQAVRPAFVKGADEGFLFLNRWGQRMQGNAVREVVKRSVKLSGLEKNASPHTLRHTCASHMLRNGAPIRHLQEMLGHESLESTQVYTHVTINDLKEIHAKYHPSQKLPK